MENRMLRQHRLQPQPLESCVFELCREYERYAGGYLRFKIYLHYFRKERESGSQVPRSRQICEQAGPKTI